MKKIEKMKSKKMQELSENKMQKINGGTTSGPEATHYCFDTIVDIFRRDYKCSYDIGNKTYGTYTAL